MTAISTKRAPQTPDATVAAAVDVARAALVEAVGEDAVGDHLGVEAEQDRVVTHFFAADVPGYRGWRWAVTAMRASRSKQVTIAETVLLPGPEALLPPQWVPWTERLRPGDLGVGDLLPTDEDDARLEPGWNASEPADATAAGDEVSLAPFYEVARELDVVRPRVLSPIGLDDALDRWREGDTGPHAPMALAAPAHCASCGFRIPLRGSLSGALGICANEMSPSDGHVVTLDYGCGAHSEAVVIPTMADRSEPVIDEVAFAEIDVGDTTSSDDAPEPSVTAAESAEELGHG